MIGVRLKNRVKIDDGHAKGLQIRKFFAYALQISAKEIVVEHLSFAVRTKIRLLPPLAHDAVLQRLLPRPVKTIGKDLIHHAAFEPLGRLVFFVVNGQLPIDGIAAEHGALMKRTAAQKVSADREIIEK